MSDLRSKFQGRTIVLLTTFLLALTLAGCGGDGGGGGSDGGSGGSSGGDSSGGSNNDGSPTGAQSLVIDQNNADDVARATLSATKQEGDTSFPGLGGGGSGADRRVTTSGDGPHSDISSLCDGGGSADLTTSGSGPEGANVTIVYSSCTVGDTTVNGTVSVDTSILDSNDPDDEHDDWKTRLTLTCDLEISNNGVPDSCHDTYTLVTGFDGATDQVYVTFRDTTYEIDGTEVVWNSDGPYYTTSDTDSDGIREFELDGTFSYGEDGSVTVTTTEPFEVDPDTGKLNRGEIVIEGANGSKLVLSASPDGDLRIQLDANGDGDFTDDGDLDAEFGYGCFLSNTCATI